LAKQFAPVFDIDDLQFLPNYNTAVRMMIGGVPVQPFSMAILPPLGNPNKQLAEALKQLSAAKYGRSKASVGAEIAKRLATVPPARPSLPGGPQSIFDKYGLPPTASSRPAVPAASPFKQPSAQTAQPSAPKPRTSSFLDEWLEKRKSSLGPKTPRPNPPAQQAAAAPPQAQMPPPPAAKEDAFKIDRGQNMADSGTMHIDKDGNISYGS
jgi:hypothetical protein